MLKEEGMDVSAGTVASILKKNRYSRQQNRKMKEASEPGPHRDEQFEIISRKTKEFEKKSPLAHSTSYKLRNPQK